MYQKDLIYVSEELTQLKYLDDFLQCMPCLSLIQVSVIMLFVPEFFLPVALYSFSLLLHI